MTQSSEEQRSIPSEASSSCQTRDEHSPSPLPDLKEKEKEGYGLQTIDGPQHCTGWRTIDSAPPYRVPVLLIAKYPTGRGWTDIYYGWRNAGGANWDRWPHDFRPTHWMLPTLPEDPA